MSNTKLEAKLHFFRIGSFIEHSIFESRGFLLSLLGGGHKQIPLTSPEDSNVDSNASYTTLLVLFYFDLELKIANLES